MLVKRFKAVFSGFLALWLLAGCGGADKPPQQIPALSQAPFVSAAITRDVRGKWSRSCVLCHVNGEGGAPRIGHPEEWRARLAQGEDVVLRHAIEGYNNMPPLGYCEACELEDLRALIKLMAAGASP